MFEIYKQVNPEPIYPTDFLWTMYTDKSKGSIKHKKHDTDENVSKENNALKSKAKGNQQEAKEK